MNTRVPVVAGVILSLIAAGCGGGGGGGGSDSTNVSQGSTGGTGAVPATKADLPVATFATTGRDGAWSRVDLIPVFQGSPTTPLAPPSAEQLALLNALQTTSGTDLSGDWAGPNPSLPTSGFDTYATGLPPGSLAGYILAANNIYDMLQSTTGKPEVAANMPITFSTQFPGYTGGDIDADFVGGDTGSEGGPGLFSNVPFASLAPGRAVPPALPPLPNTMGAATGSGRGPSTLDEHQFIQADFAYPLDTGSLFNPTLTSNSFLGDTSAAMGTGNVNIVKHAVIHPPAPDDGNRVDQLPEHVTGIAVVGGVTAIPTGFVGTGLPEFAFFDPTHATFNRVPTGAAAKLMDPTVFTYIAHENPQGFVPAPFGGPPANTDGYIVDTNGVDGNGLNAGMIVLPLPKNGTGKGGRVFGATVPEVGSVNDFESDGDETAAAIGFMSVEFEWVRTGGELVRSPYFHSFAFDQANVGADTRAVGSTTSVNGSFNRGAAITVSTIQVPSIDIFDPSVDAIGPYDPQPSSDSVNTISTRARFRIDFDREVVPNSVGFSRRHTLHSTAGLGVVFPFNGNTRPISNPTNSFSSVAEGSPLASSIYLAINQPAGVNQLTSKLTGVSLLQPVASAFVIAGAPGTDPNEAFFADDGVTLVSGEANCLTPEAQNLLASLPRGIVPVDIYPVNQNNLQAYIVEPLVELPPGSPAHPTVVTLGVTRGGLGTTAYAMVNRGNHTRSGTMFTPFQALELSTGLGDDPSVKQSIFANNSIIKVNAGPMTLDGLQFYGGTNVALHRRVNQDPEGFSDDLTTGGYNVSRSFKVGSDNNKRYINAPVAPQALYLAYTTGGAGILDLAGNGYTTNAPGGGLGNAENKFYLESSRFLPLGTQTLGLTKFNWVQGGSNEAGNFRRSFGILGRYTAGDVPLFGNVQIESDLAVGAPISTGNLTPQPGINEGSSGYETLVRSGIVQGDSNSATVVLAPVAKVGIVTDIEVGDFLDSIYFDPENPWTFNGHKTYNTPLQGTLDNNTIADLPTPNPPPLRFPVGLPHTAVLFDQSDLVKPPFLIEGNEVFPSDSFYSWESGPFISGSPVSVNGLLFLNPKHNLSNGTIADLPQLPNAGFANTFFGQTVVTNPAYIQTGPVPKTSTGAGALLASINLANGAGFANPSGLARPYYQSRQQIGNFLFVADNVNNKLHALNSNTMEILESLKLPDPYGLGLSPDLGKLFVSNEGDASVSIVDADPRHPSTFMTEIKRVKVGSGPRSVACNPDGEDVFVCNYSGNTISILNQTTGNVRKTLISNGLNRPYDIAVGMREYVGGPGFQSGTYHAYISNFNGDNVLVFEGGPDGLAGIGFDNIIASVNSDTPSSGGQVWRQMRKPRGIIFNPDAQLDGFNQSIGCYVAHQDQQGRALVSRITYTKDQAPGQQVFNTTFFNPFIGEKVFEVDRQYLSTFAGVAFDVALPDYHRERFVNEDFGSYYNLLNAGATPKTLPTVERNWKFPLADNIVPATFDSPRWEPDRLYFSVGGSQAQKLIEVFDLVTGTHLKTITTPVQVGVMASYFSQ